MDKLYGKTLTDLNVRALGAFAAHLGGAGLGRWRETIAFVEQCLSHDAIEERGDTWCSLQRALAVLHRCAGNESATTDAIAAGVRNPSEHCRVAGLTAQALVARNRPQDAIKPLQEALALLEQIPPDDEAAQQLVVICQGVQRASEQRARANLNLQLGAATAIAQVMQHHPEWKQRHRAHHSRPCPLGPSPPHRSAC